MYSSGKVGSFLFFFLLTISVPLLCLSSTSEAEISWRNSLLKSQKRQNIIKQFLIPHNKERAKLGLGPLRWSEKLAKYAAWWAQQRQGDCGLIHSNSEYGENLFWGSGKDWKPADAVAEWAAEKPYYNHNTNSCSKNKDCLHYTQMVWRESLKIGCARVICSNSGDTFITCNYFPHGNVIGQKPF